jgi:predicted dithiol-disulfide oxidoreductase (DUF899 family)
MEGHQVVSAEEWLDARIELLAKEKELTRLRDTISAQRRALPWVRIEKEYLFGTPEGQISLFELFEGRSQLIVKHSMMGPRQANPCVGCAFEADHVEGALVHLQNHDVSYAAVARAPIEEVEPFRRRMGWPFRFVSSFHSDFNYDFNVSFAPGQAHGGTIYYNCQNRQVPMEDLSGRSVFYRKTMVRSSTPTLPSAVARRPNYSLADWVRPHDMYGKGGAVEGNGRYHSTGQASTESA